MARAWVLKTRPSATLSTDIFALETLPDAPLGDGEVRVYNRWTSVDPYLRGLLDGEGAYMTALPLGMPMFGGAVGEVIESRSAEFPIGSQIVHERGWRDVSVVPAADCMAVDDPEIGAEHYLGHFGMPGITGYFGLLHVGEAKTGETLFVSSAAGAVGTVVVQIAKAVGMRVIGSAGGSEKCAQLAALGAHATIDYKQGNLSARLREAAPNGIDVYFDNVGGDHLAAAIDNAAIGMRVVLCGMISGYGGKAEMRIADPMRLVGRRIQLRGLFAPDFYHLRQQFLDDMHRWAKAGALRCPTAVHEGLENVPAAFVSLFGGTGVGKVLVKLA